ncbi:MAG TPA: glycosyltransferase family 39 protein, partial [Vicinamibacteria bacterium]|nr:glycosyltransferase family 39 protein [Vicinamibacteria bacterium]
MKRRLLGAVLVGTGSAFLLVATAGDYGLTWDEPTYVAIANHVTRWFSGLRCPGAIALFEPQRLHEDWPFATRANRNLPVPILVSIAGHSASERWLPPPESYRLGHCLLMALTLGVLFGCLDASRGPEAAVVGAASLLLMPQAFAHAHFDATDVPVSCFWVLATLAWLRPASSRRADGLTALVVGLGLASKATFALLPAVLALHMVLFRQWQLWRRGLALLLLSPIVMLAFCPMWWPHPLASEGGYLWRVLHASAHWKIDLYYLGRSYVENYPWHNGFVLLAVGTPPWTLALAVFGACFALYRRDPSGGVWTLGALTLPLLRVLPSSAAHDGMRLMMPSLFCLAPLAACGFADVCALLGPLRLKAAARWAMIATLLALGVRAIASMHPYEVSYYSEAIGGLPGASRLGFEVTYWFDALTPQALREIEDRLPEGARVWTAPHYTGYRLLRKWGAWRPDLASEDSDEDPDYALHLDADYLILYTRKGYLERVPFLHETLET